MVQSISDPPHVLKLFYQPGINQGESAEVGSILDHQENEQGKTMYLVKWKDQSNSHSWVLSSDFDNETPIREYWNRVRTSNKPTKAKRKPDHADHSHETRSKRAKTIQTPPVTRKGVMS
jgi:hypothetical protein